MNIKTTLYQKNKLNFLGMTVGTIGTLARSTYHSGSVGPKLSNIVRVFDSLTNPGLTSCYVSCMGDDMVYCEFGPVSALCNGKTIRWIETVTTEQLQRYGYDVYALWTAAASGNAEFSEHFCECLEAIRDKDDLAVQSEAFILSDSFYFKNVFTDGLEEVEERTDLTKEEIEASFRSGMFVQEFRAFPEFFVKSAYDKGSIKTESKEKEKETMQDFFEDCKAGKYRIKYDFENKDLIPSLKVLDTYEPIPQFRDTVKKIFFRLNRQIERLDMGLTHKEILGKDFVNILFLGKPGTGKTMLVQAVAATCGLPLGIEAISKHTDEDAAEGKTKIVDGKPTFVETDVLKIHQNGGIALLEEINLGDPGVMMGSFGQAIWSPFIIKKNGYENVYRHPLTVYIACMNTGTKGSNATSEPLMNRFKTKPILDDPTEDDFIKILMKATGKEEKVARWVYDAYQKTVELLLSPDINATDVAMNLSIRTCVGAIEDMEEGLDYLTAMTNAIVGAIAVKDLELAEIVRTNVILALPTPSFTL